MASFFKKLGKKIQKVGQTAGKILGQVVAPAASVFLGPLGGAIATPIGAALTAVSTKGDRKDKASAALQTAAIGAGSALGTAVLSQAVTGEAGSSVLGSIAKLLGIGQAPNNATGEQGAAVSEETSSVLGNSNPSGLSASAGGRPAGSLMPILVIGGIAVAAYALTRKRAA